MSRIPTEHFSLRELQCPCCERADFQEGFLDRLERLRVDFGEIMPINSGFRCPNYNETVSKTGRNGPHTRGAVDVAVCGAKTYRMLLAALRAGFTGIGLRQSGPYPARFMHLDALPHSLTSPRPRIWTY